MTNTLIIDRFNINYEIHVVFNSLSRHSCFASGDLADHNCFSSPCSLSIVLAYISLIRSSFCHEIHQTLRSSQLYAHSSFRTNIMYIHSTIYNYLWQLLPQKPCSFFPFFFFVVKRDACTLEVSFSRVERLIFQIFWASLANDENLSRAAHSLPFVITQSTQLSFCQFSVTHVIFTWMLKQHLQCREIFLLVQANFPRVIVQIYRTFFLSNLDRQNGVQSI